MANILDFFNTRLHAPLATLRGSWSAVRNVPGDEAVILGVWQRDVLRLDDRMYVLIYGGHHWGYPGRVERMMHIEMAQEGMPCYLVMCRRDEYGRIAGFNSREIWETGEIIEHDGGLYIEMTAKRTTPLSSERLQSDPRCAKPQTHAKAE